MSKLTNSKPYNSLTIPIGWDVKALLELCEICYGKEQKSVVAENGKYEIYGTGGIVGRATKFLYDKPSILIGRKGSIDEPTLIERPFWAIDTTYYTKIKNGVSIDWLFYKLLSLGLRRYNEASGVPSLSRENLYRIKFPVPKLSEQKAIAHILSGWDNAIVKTQKLIVQSQLRNKWLMQQLLTGKGRIKNFVKSGRRHKTSLGELPVDWKLNSIKNILSPIKKSFTPRHNELYQQIGIRSHTKGIFYKEKVTGKTLGEKSVFWIEPDCFIVNIVFAWEHAISKTTEKENGMIASHRFPMYKPKTGVLDLDYLLCYFKSLRGKHLLGLASPGGAGRNKTLGQSEFVKLQIPTPSLQEQIAIATLINSAEREIELLKTKLELLKEQKKGLMQILLTGKKRIEIK
jgi:restriction endonuclease S subunit